MDNISSLQASLPATPSVFEPAKIPAHRLRWTGNVTEIYRIFLLNLFMTIITLGIYRFWGKARMRKYIASHFILSGQSFEYTGTGKELFIGFLKMLCIVAAYAALTYYSWTINPWLSVVCFYGVVLLMPLIVFMSMRYRLRTLKWRGIRFGLAGNAVTYGSLAFSRNLANIFSLSLLVPRSDIIKWNYIASNIRYGTIKTTFRTERTHLRKMFTAHILSPVFFLSGMVVFIFIIDMLTKPIFAMIYIHYGLPVDRPPPVGTDAYFYTITLAERLVYVAWLIPYHLTRCIYKSHLMKAKLIGLDLGGVRFKSTASGADLMFRKIGNFLLIFFSLGLAYPIVLDRNARYYQKYIVVGGDLEKLHAEQAVLLKTSAASEFMADDVDLGVGLELGI